MSKYSAWLGNEVLEALTPSLILNPPVGTTHLSFNFVHISTNDISPAYAILYAAIKIMDTGT